MRIIFNEIKKIFNFKMLILLIFINIIMYFSFIEFYIIDFPNGRPSKDIYRIMVNMKNEYGSYMDESKFQDFIAGYNHQINEADNYIKEHKEFKELGIKNYKDLMKKSDFMYKDKELREKVNNLYSNIMFEKGMNLFWELEVKDDMIKRYEGKETSVLNYVESNFKHSPNKAQKARLQEILNKKSEFSVFHRIILKNYQALIIRVSIIIILSVIFMISPIFIKDNKNKINSLQYTSKKGRNIFKAKVIAGIVTSLIITTVQLIEIFILYSYNNVGMFFNSNINSFLAHSYAWYDITFIQYIIISIVSIYILAVAFSILSMIVSSRAKNYIALIGVQLPILFLFFILFLRKAVIYIVSVGLKKEFPFVFYFLVISIALISIILRWKKEKICDV